MRIHMWSTHQQYYRVSALSTVIPPKLVYFVG